MKINQIKVGVILSYVVIALNMIIGIAYTPILTGSLGQSEYGLYSIVSSIISYLTILDFGFGNAIIIYTAKYRAKNEEEKEQKLHGMFFAIYLGIGFVAAIIGTIITFNVENIFGKTMTQEEITTAKTLMKILTFNLAITFPFSIFSSIITAYEKFIFSKVVNIIRIVLNPLIMVVLLNLGYKSVALVTLITVLNVVTLLINFFYCKSKLKIKMKFGKMNIPLLKEISAYSFFVFLGTIIDKINWNLGQFILGAVSGTISAAIYSIAVQLINMFMSFSTAISGVLLPKVTKMQTNNASDKEFTNFFIKTGRIQFLIIALVVTGFIIFGKEFIEIIWLGEDYSMAYYMACMLMVALCIPLIQNVGLSILQAKNKYRYRCIMLSVVAVLNLIISIPLGKLYGGMGVSFVTAICLLIGQGIILNVYYHKKVGLNIIEFWKEIFKMAIPLIPLFIISLIINNIYAPKSILDIVIQIICYTMLYVVIMYVFSTNEYERELIKFPIRRILRKVAKNENNS